MLKAGASRELGATGFVSIEMLMNTALLLRLRRRNHDQQQLTTLMLSK